MLPCKATYSWLAGEHYVGLHIAGRLKRIMQVCRPAHNWLERIMLTCRATHSWLVEEQYADLYATHSWLKP
jgi:hypothetical protein